MKCGKSQSAVLWEEDMLKGKWIAYIAVLFYLELDEGKFLIRPKNFKVRFSIMFIML